MKKYSVIFIALMLCLSFSACGSEKNDSKKQENPATLEQNSEVSDQADKIENASVALSLVGGDWGMPSPYLHYSRGPGGFKMELLFDGLLEKDEKGTIPWLAKTWQISEDGKTYTFVLQDGVFWHDGEKLTADDVAFTFEYYKAHPPVWNSLMVNDSYIVQSAEALDEKRIKIVVDTANATYLGRLGKARILPKHIWKDVADPNKYSDEKATIGCGPYQYVSYSKEQGTYKFKAFEKFWGPKQNVSVIEWIPVSDATLAFEKGDIDTLSPSPDIINRYQENNQYEVKKNKGFWGYRLIFNMEKRPEFKDVKLRKALAYGINRSEMVEKVARNAAMVASVGYIPPEHVWYNNSVVKYDYNPEKAKTLLNGQRYQFELLTGNKGTEVKLAELIKMTLKQSGIDVTIKSVDMKSRDSAVKDKNFEMVLIGHGGWGRDADMLREIYGATMMADGSPASHSLPGYYNGEIDDLAQSQMIEFDEVKRKQMIDKLQLLIAEDVAQLPLYNTKSYFVYRPQKYDGWMYNFDHHYPEHCKLSYLKRD